MLEDNLETSIIIALVSVIWLVGKRYFLDAVIYDKFPKIVTTINLFVIPLTILLIGSLIYDGLKQLGIDGLNEHINALTLLCIFFTVGWCLARFAEIFLLSMHKDEEATYLPGLQRGLLFGGFLFISSILFFNIMEYSITGIYVSTGAVAALVAFAMQKTLGDLFSGIALSIERPFHLGDWIELEDGSQGQIIDINWRATRLSAWDKTTMVVPNSVLAQQRITNMHGSNHVYAPWYEIKIPAEVDPRLAKALLLEAALRCDRVLKKPLPVVRLIDATTVPYVYLIWVHFPSYRSMFAGREQLLREIHYTLKNAGVQVAPQIQELHTRRAEVMNVEPPTTLLALKSLDIASSLTDAELEHLVKASERHTYDAGTVLTAEGECSKAFNIILHGIVETSVKTASGTSKIIDELKPGQYYGLYAMIVDSLAFQQFTAVTDVTLIRINMDALRALLIKRPDLQEKFAKIAKQRMDTAQEIRLSVNKSPIRLTVHDILRKIEKLVH